MDIQPIPALDDNYIWRIAHNGNAVVIDPGEAHPVLADLHAEGLGLAAILLTHRHPDHIAGAAELGKRFGCPIYGPAGVAGVNRVVEDGDVVVLNDPDLELQVMAVPGHVREHIAYRMEGHCFCGDTLFSAGCGRVFDGDAHSLFHSLERLSTLPKGTRFYPAHEYTLNNLEFALHVEPDNVQLLPFYERVRALRAQGKPSLPTSLAQELEINPFLRDTPTLRQAVARHFGEEPQTRLDLFLALRDWKNSF